MRAPRATTPSASHDRACTHRSHFPHFVDDYLAYLHEVLPSQASLDGVHLHDDLLEDLSRPAIDAHVRALSGFGRRLHQIDPAHLPPVEQVEHPIVAANIEARMYELEAVRTWERNPQMYADIIGTSLAGQALFAYAPEAERARRVVSKLRQVPRLVQAARDNIKECPGIFVKVGLETLARRRCKFIETRPAARVLGARRPAHPRRPRRHVHRGGRRDRGLHRVPRDRSGAARQGVVPAGARALRAEAEARRGHHAQRRSAADDRAARAARGAGGVPHASPAG